MAERKWGAITSGATFESLASTIIFFEDPGASLFGRDGKDGGQDARSGDGTLVFQAKHHVGGSSAAALRDARKEAKKIASYQQPSSSRHEQWKSVTHWRLVTNAAFNPTDEQTWEAEIVPLFVRLGITPDYWEVETLNALLDKHPEIHRSFFENETRVFLSVPEVKERLPFQEPFLRRDELAPFCGRTQETAKIREFLTSDKLFLVVHGSGGTGKTRLLVEAGDEIANDGQWQVLWANVESMASTGAWFAAVVPERATVLLVDEPSNEALLQQLAEQLGGRVGRAARWKVVVAVRSPKDPVLRFLRGARMKPRVEEMRLPELPAADAESMCFELLETGKLAGLAEVDRRSAAQQLSARFSRFPVWLTLAVQHLEDNGNLKQIPVDAKSLAEEYLREIESSQADIPPEHVRDLLRWVALIGPINREDESSIQAISDGSETGSAADVRERLACLLRRGALRERGARNRFIELKPDVLRDHVLLHWLATDVGGDQAVVESEDAKKLLAIVRVAIMSGSLNGLGRRILLSLARTEFLLQLSDRKLRLISALLEELEASMGTMSASQRLALADLLEAIALFQPRATASLVGLMRRSSAADETTEGIFGPRVIGQPDVLLSLAWPLFSGAMGATSEDDCEAVLRELCLLVEDEAELARTHPHGLPNDGKRAGALVTRVLQGGPQFWNEYDNAAKLVALELIESLKTQAPTRGQAALLKALVEPMLALERRQAWTDEHAFTWRMFEIAPQSPAFIARDEILFQLKEILVSGSAPSESLVQLWHVFARARDGGALDRLEWTHEVLTKRCASLEELSAAREVWDWFRRFETDPQVKAAADALEQLYATNDLAKEFQPLLTSLEDVKEHDALVNAKAQNLAAASQSRELADFVERAIAFLGNDEALHRFGGIAWSLGTYAESREVVRQFVFASLKDPTINSRSEFVIRTAVRWVAMVRRSEPAHVHILVKELLAECGSDDRRAHLLERIYGRAPKLSIVGEFTAQEHWLVRSSRELFDRTGRQVAFVTALALSLHHEWPTLRPLLEDVLCSIPTERLPQTMDALVDATYWAVKGNDNAPQPPAGLSEWLVSQLLALPDLDALGDVCEWHLRETLERLGGLDVRWLPGALGRRQQHEMESGSDFITRAVSHRARISKYVRPLTPSDVADVEVVEALNHVLDFINDDGTVGYYLAEILRDIDPNGLLVPTAAVARLSKVVGVGDLRRIARVARTYPVNSAQWRMIALAVTRAAMPLGTDALQAVHSALGDRGVRSWSGTRGEVPPIFITAVAEARVRLSEEVEADLLPYWQQRLAVAEAELRDQEERAKEERGE